MYRQTRIRNNLELRSSILSSIRSFFNGMNFLEVETPIRIPAPAPEANIDAQESGCWYLQTSPELCMKRLLSAGYNKIFQLCKCFRKNERGDFHLPEMTLLEWYEAGVNYEIMMSQSESLVKYIAKQLNCENGVSFRGREVDFAGTWDKITVKEAFSKYASIDIESTVLSLEEFNEIMCFEIEPNLGNTKPVFLYNYPATLASLARLSPENSTVAERFELYCAGVELCNAFTELTDSLEQKYRFQLEQKQRRLENKSVYPMPEPFLNALSDMPMASGNAMGVDRLVMLFSDAQKIDQVVAFIPEEL